MLGFILFILGKIDNIIYMGVDLVKHCLVNLQLSLFPCISCTFLYYYLFVAQQLLFIHTLFSFSSSFRFTGRKKLIKQLFGRERKAKEKRKLHNFFLYF